MSKHSFLAATPLHVMISIALIRQLRLESSANLKIIDSFAGAEAVFNRVRSLNWDLGGVRYSFFRSKRRAYLDCIKDETDTIYSDNDASFQTYFDQLWMKLLRPSMEICVFEDGIGSYRTDLYHGIKKRIFDFIGVGTYMGGGPFTSKMFVYDRGKYLSKFPNNRSAVIEINTPLVTFINNDARNIRTIFGYKKDHRVKSDLCSVYLSSWKIDKSFVRSISAGDEDTFVKLHPHIRVRPDDLDVNFLDQSVPAEIILSHFSELYKRVRVYHHRSSVHQYINSSNVEFVEIPLI